MGEAKEKLPVDVVLGLDCSMGVFASAELNLHIISDGSLT